MSYDVIGKKIETIKFLIQRDGLILPNDLEAEIISLVASNISKYPSNELILKESEYDIEMEKVLGELQKYFDDKIVEKYQEEVISRRIIHPCLPPNKYITSFRGPQIPWDLNIPIKLNDLSYIYIGHEVIHVLKEGRNPLEWTYLLLYSEVLPMLYEFIQTNGMAISKRALDWRCHELKEMYNNVHHKKELSQLDNDTLKYYQMPEDMYLISFYYALLLYSLYKQSPKEILTEMQNVLHHKITTKELLERLNLLNDVNKTSFNDEYRKLMLNI